VETSPLRSRGFLLLWSSYAVATLGGWLQLIAISVWIYERTGSALAVGGSLAVRQLPAAVMGWVGGVLSDRYDRRRVIIGGIIMKAAAALCLLVLGDRALFSVILLVSALSSGGESLTMPARSATVPMVVEKEGVLRANSILYSTDNFVTMVGALAGGMLTSIWGIYRLCAANIACLGISAVLVACIRFRGSLQTGISQASRPRLSVSLRDGTTYLRDHAPAMLLIAVYASWTIGVGMSNVAIVVLPQTTFRSGAAGVGVLYAAVCGGAFLGSFASKPVLRRIPLSRSIPLVIAVCGMADIALGSCRMLWQGAALIFAAGLMDGILTVSTETSLMDTVPVGLLGRVFGVRTGLAMLSAMAGTLAGGIINDRFSSAACMQAAGLIMIGASMIALWQRKRIGELDVTRGVQELK